MAETVSGLLTIDEARKQLAGLISGLDVHYDLGEGHPLLGRRMPDLDVVTTNRQIHMYTLLRDARAVLLNLETPGSLNPGPWADQVQLVDATYDGEWELPVIGSVRAPAAVLIRPDGHVAWTGDEPPQGLEDALAIWFGPGVADFS